MSSAKIFSYPLVIQETYLDSFGHVNNAVYLNLFEEARWDLITKNGYGLKKIKETKIGPTILEIKIKFLKELYPRDQIMIQTELIDYQKKIATLSQKMLRNDEICCTAELNMALFDLTQRKLILPTEEWLRALGGN